MLSTQNAEGGCARNQRRSQAGIAAMASIDNDIYDGRTQGRSKAPAAGRMPRWRGFYPAAHA